MTESMTYADHFWLSMDDPTNLMVITAFMEFEEPVDFNRLSSTIERRLLTIPRFRKRIVRSPYVLGVPAWETDDHFDIRSHIHRVALPQPADKDELQNMISDLMMTPLDPNKPLWQVHLIENYRKGCVILFRINHCIADGIALIHILLSAADKEPDAPLSEDLSEKAAGGISSSPSRGLGSLIGKLQRVSGLTQNAGKKLVDQCMEALSSPDQLVEMAKSGSALAMNIASALAKLTIRPSDPDTSFKGRLGVRKSAVWTDPMPLDKIKIVGRTISTATLNDVLIATVTGAMRRYLKSRNYRVNELDLRVVVPVNIRKPGTEDELGNKFSLVFLPLPVYLEDPVLRLKEVKRRTDHLKKSPDAILNFGLLSAIGLLPPNIARKLAHQFSNRASAVLTNVPGPREPLYFAGRKISNIMFWVPRTGTIGLGISILSYDGKVTVGITADEGLMPDPEVLLYGFEDEFNHLLDLVTSGKIFDEPLVLHDRYRESRCKAVTRSGKQCKKQALSDSDYCRLHQQEGKEENGQDREAVEEDLKPEEGHDLHSKAIPGRCKAMTKSGKPCKNRAAPGLDFCTIHRTAALEEDSRELAQIIRDLSES